MKGLLHISGILGLLITIPLCALIYRGMGSFETGVSFKQRVKSEIDALSKVYNIWDNYENDPYLVYPLRRKLTNAEGKEIDSVITGKSGEVLRFLSLLDNQNYEYLIKDLSAEDTEFVAKLPEFEKTPLSYPVVRKLNTTEGLKMIAIIGGRSQFDFHYSTLENSAVETMAINQLSIQDRNFVFRLPTSE